MTGTCMWITCQKLLYSNKTAGSGTQCGNTISAQLYSTHMNRQSRQNVNRQKYSAHKQALRCSVQTRKVQLFGECGVHRWHLFLATQRLIAWRRLLVVSDVEPGSGQHLFDVNDAACNDCFFQFMTKWLNKPGAAWSRWPAVTSCIADRQYATATPQ